MCGMSPHLSHIHDLTTQKQAQVALGDLGMRKELFGPEELRTSEDHVGGAHGGVVYRHGC